MKSNYARKLIVIILCTVIGIFIGGVVANYSNKDINEEIDILRGQSKFMSQYGAIHDPDYYSNKYSDAADIVQQEATINIIIGRYIGGIIGAILGLLLPTIRKKNSNNQVDNGKPKAPLQKSPSINEIKNITPTVESLLKRAELFLEDKDYKSAGEYYNRILDNDPECAKAYMGLLLAEQKFKDINELASSGMDITEYGSYKRALQFADYTYKEILEDLDPQTFERKESDRKENIYKKAEGIIKLATSSVDYMKAYELYESIAGYKDADQRLITCKELIKDSEKTKEENRIKSKKEYEERLEQARIIEVKNTKIKKVSAILIFSLLAISITIISVKNYIIPWSNYSSANKLLENKQYFDAANAFAKLDDFSDSKEISHSLLQKLSTLISTDMNITVGLKKDGTVVATGHNADGQCDVSSWNDIVAISAGYKHTVGLKNDGTVVAVGYNGFGECDVSSWNDIVAISAGTFYTVGLKKDGTVVATGDNKYGQCDVSSWEGIVTISANDYMTVGLKKDGTVVATGNNEDWQCDVSSWRDIVAISATGYHTVGLKKDGTVVATGNNEDGQCDVSSWNDIVSISTERFNTVGLKKDGTVVAVGDNRWGVCDVSSWTDIVTISVTGYETMGLKEDGTVITTGDNGNGACDVSSWTDIIAIYTDYTHAIGLKKDGTVIAAGSALDEEYDFSDWNNITLSDDIYNFGNDFQKTLLQN